jgi:hypothetical protein
VLHTRALDVCAKIVEEYNEKEQERERERERERVKNQQKKKIFTAVCCMRAEGSKNSAKA